MVGNGANNLPDLASMLSNIHSNTSHAIHESRNDEIKTLTNLHLDSLLSYINTNASHAIYGKDNVSVRRNGEIKAFTCTF